MKNKFSGTHILIKATALFIMLPIYLGLLSGMIKLFGSSYQQKSVYGILLIGVLITVLLSAFLLIRSGKLALPVIVLVGILSCGSTIISISGICSRANGKTTWTLEGNFSIPGMDVYCNGVHLGQTPLRITEQEFYAKVKPWEAPPRQERTTLREDDLEDDTGFCWKKYMWIPADFIEYTKRWPDEQMQRHLEGIPKNEDVFAFCKQTPFWWHFEKDGCMGLARLESLLSWGGGGGPAGVELSTSSSVEFPSLDKHFEVFIADLKRNDWQPTESWMTHFDTYKDLLFGKLHEYAKKNQQAKPSLDAVVRREMNIPTGELSDAQKREVMENVLQRAEERSEFHIPSFESEAARLVCANQPELISEYYLKYARSSHHYQSMGWSDNSVSCAPGSAIRLPVMRWIISKYQPPQVYNQLVYALGDLRSMDRFLATTELKLLLNYPRPESEKILDYYLKTKQNKKPGPFGRAHDNEDIIRFLTGIHNPLLEQKIRDFVRNNPGRTNWDHDTERFVESRVKRYPTDPNLPGWIHHYVQLRDDDKIQLIAKLKTKSINHPLNYLCSGSPRLRNRALGALKGNPFGDEFIIDSYNYYDIGVQRGSMCDVIWAMVRIDTPAISAFVADIWDKGPDERKKFMKNLGGCAWQQPKWDWMVPMIAELTDISERVMAANVLSKIGTPEAKGLITKWSKDNDPKLASKVKWRLDRFPKNQQSKPSVAPETIDGLLSGQIKPDDLLPSATAYIWDGEKYVPETK